MDSLRAARLLTAEQLDYALLGVGCIQDALEAPVRLVVTEAADGFYELAVDGALSDRATRILLARIAESILEALKSR